MPRKGTVLVLTCLVLALGASVALAEEAQKENAANMPLVKFMFSSFSNAMQFGSLLLVSIATLALTVEHFVTIRRDKLIPPELVGEIEMLLEDGEYGEALELCEAERSPFTNVIAAAIPNYEHGFEEVKDSALAAVDSEGNKLMQKVSWLSFCAAVAPLLGLLGTIIGMIEAFGEIANSATSPKPSQLAGGISTALYTTAFGLVVAIPATASFFFFRYRVIKLASDLGAIAEDLIQRFRGTATE